MSGLLAGRTALVTGASRGIGRAVAVALAESGAQVVATARSSASLAELAEQIGCRAVPADIASPAGVDALVRGVRGVLGGDPDIVVNASGSFSLAPFAETDPGEFEHLLRINLTGPFLVIRAFLPGMLERRGGHIVTIGSVAGRLPLPGNAAYGASKFGLRGLHEVLSVELRGTGVRATLVEPAATDTALWDALDPDSRSDLPSRGQMLQPTEVAASVRFVLEQPEGVEVSGLLIRAERN
ncbi:MAG: SDR family oxidoreductase [Gemmatimonadota bacterium]|jgi:NAD(P)-dependent dehydrogenase (short-subunit alcohol dehydrogenase family)|nr:SDR family oxidoreductase [Gemmatimonadota bacterium]